LLQKGLPKFVTQYMYVGLWENNWEARAKIIKDLKYDLLNVD